ncbi:biotin/lipoyl-binding protein [Frigoribacterium sp. ACAM 257]|uniref:biotin/lipoyl-binding protein n=1 Tax=Frigoribacterium sp. ACAM 257 TaxID=2508998 RepID=UPI0011B95024|nr:biotin/lipoyl-binding protein [Frigoribacterium sp. ACAM 257]TWX34142.1 biotin/lipoyl-binding protein [Frigoribacterium sp. ACAM 257]
MRVAKTWIFPILRILIFLAIAVALVKLAFFAAPDAATGSVAAPTGEVVEPQVAVAVGTVTNDVTVDAAVEADAASTVPATLAGTVVTVVVERGQVVAAGDKVATLRSETPQEALVAADGTVTERAPIVKTAEVTSPVAGTVTELPVIKDQEVAVGDPVAKVAPPTFHVTGSLAADQLYRLVSRPAEGTASIQGGPAPFACTGLSIGGADAASGAPTAGDGGDGTAGGSSGQSVTCAVPGDVTVFAGLATKLTIPAGVATDVLTVPLTAVEGAAGKGVVTVVGADGAEEEREITLGINDGTTVEVTGGLVEGDMVLQFVPGAVAPQEGCVDPTTGEVYC